jgi:hypothetical protein
MTEEARATGGPILTFARSLGTPFCECQNQRTTGEYYFLVEFGFDVRLTKARLDG